METAELLDVQMKQPPWLVVFVAQERLGWLKAGQAVESRAAQQAGDGTAADVKALADLVVGLSALACFDNLLPILRGNGMGAAVRAGRTVVQPHQALLAVALEPLVGSAHTDTCGLCRFLGAQALIKDASYQQGSTMDG